MASTPNYVQLNWLEPSWDDDQVGTLSSLERRQRKAAEKQDVLAFYSSLGFLFCIITLVLVWSEISAFATAPSRALTGAFLLEVWRSAGVFYSQLQILYKHVGELAWTWNAVVYGHDFVQRGVSITHGVAKLLASGLYYLALLLSGTLMYSTYPHVTRAPLRTAAWSTLAAGVLFGAPPLYALLISRLCETCSPEPVVLLALLFGAVMVMASLRMSRSISGRLAGGGRAHPLAPPVKQRSQLPAGRRQSGGVPAGGGGAGAAGSSLHEAGGGGGGGSAGGAGPSGSKRGVGGGASGGSSAASNNNSYNRTSSSSGRGCGAGGAGSSSNNGASVGGGGASGVAFDPVAAAKRSSSSSSSFASASGHTGTPASAAAAATAFAGAGPNAGGGTSSNGVNDPTQPPGRGLAGRTGGGSTLDPTVAPAPPHPKTAGGSSQGSRSGSITAAAAANACAYDPVALPPRSSAGAGAAAASRGGSAGGPGGTGSTCSTGGGGSGSAPGTSGGTGSSSSTAKGSGPGSGSRQQPQRQAPGGTAGGGAAGDGTGGRASTSNQLNPAAPRPAAADPVAVTIAKQPSGPAAPASAKPSLPEPVPVSVTLVSTTSTSSKKKGAGSGTGTLPASAYGYLSASILNPVSSSTSSTSPAAGAGGTGAAASSAAPAAAAAAARFIAPPSAASASANPAAAAAAPAANPVAASKPRADSIGGQKPTATASVAQLSAPAFAPAATALGTGGVRAAPAAATAVPPVAARGLASSSASSISSTTSSSATTGGNSLGGGLFSRLTASVAPALSGRAAKKAAAAAAARKQQAAPAPTPQYVIVPPPPPPPPRKSPPAMAAATPPAVDPVAAASGAAGTAACPVPPAGQQPVRNAWLNPNPVIKIAAGVAKGPKGSAAAGGRPTAPVAAGYGAGDSPLSTRSSGGAVTFPTAATAAFAAPASPPPPSPPVSARSASCGGGGPLGVGVGVTTADPPVLATRSTGILTAVAAIRTPLPSANGPATAGGAGIFLSSSSPCCSPSPVTTDPIARPPPAGSPVSAAVGEPFLFPSSSPVAVTGSKAALGIPVSAAALQPPPASPPTKPLYVHAPQDLHQHPQHPQLRALQGSSGGHPGLEQQHQLVSATILTTDPCIGPLVAHKHASGDLDIASVAADYRPYAATPLPPAAAVTAVAAAVGGDVDSDSFSFFSIPPPVISESSSMDAVAISFANLTAAVGVVHDSENAVLPPSVYGTYGGAGGGTNFAALSSFAADPVWSPHVPPVPSGLFPPSATATSLSNGGAAAAVRHSHLPPPGFPSHAYGGAFAAGPIPSGGPWAPHHPHPPPASPPTAPAATSSPTAAEAVPLPPAGERGPLASLGFVDDNADSGSAGGEDAAGSCTICWSAPRQVGFLHGKTSHLCVCRRCAAQLREGVHRCPMCRQLIERIIDIF